MSANDALVAASVAADDFIKSRIFTVRGVHVMIDRDLAVLYGVEVKRLNARSRTTYADGHRSQHTHNGRLRSDAPSAMSSVVGDCAGISLQVEGRATQRSWGTGRRLRAMLSFLSACFWRGERGGDEGLRERRNAQWPVLQEFRGVWPHRLIRVTFSLTASSRFSLKPTEDIGDMPIRLQRFFQTIP